MPETNVVRSIQTMLPHLLSGGSVHWFDHMGSFDLKVPAKEHDMYTKIPM